MCVGSQRHVTKHKKIFLTILHKTTEESQNILYEDAKHECACAMHANYTKSD